MYNSDYYKMLNVASNATEAEIKAAFVKARQGATPETIQRLNEAYKVLSDNTERTKYNQWYNTQNISTDTSVSSPAPRPTPIPNQDVTIGVPSAKQVKILNLNNFTTRVVAVNNIDANKFPPAQYCDNGLYYAIEKNNQIAICNKSQWDNLYRQAVRTNATNHNQSTKTRSLKKVVIGVVLFIVFIIIVSRCNNDNQINKTADSDNVNNPAVSTETTHDVEEKQDEYKEVEKPESGTVSHIYDSYDNASVLTIQLPMYETTTYYYLKLANSETDEIVQSVFIHPGKTESIIVPCGTYELKYACGSKWYGYERLFGKYGSYSKSENPVSFEQGYEYTLTLKSYIGSGANSENSFSTDDIDLEDF